MQQDLSPLISKGRVEKKEDEEEEEEGAMALHHLWVADSRNQLGHQNPLLASYPCAYLWFLRFMDSFKQPAAAK